ncbi:hypothetical protein CPB85DRAFT_395668 [Mucidula mucida]|nr:hypothetical protein CPB85DRAFT_395668 [Mucidula mucida]
MRIVAPESLLGHSRRVLILFGRVTDASPVIAASQWWHGWSWNAYDRLTGTLLAGHSIECGAYCTGGNFSGFKSLGAERCIDLAFPIAEVSVDGTFVITRPEEGDFNGVVTIDTVRSQILYELQGNIYLNPDVVCCNCYRTKSNHCSVTTVELRLRR